MEKKDVNLDSASTILEGKVDKNTQFELLAHGVDVGYSHHTIVLEHNGIISLRAVLNILDRLTPDPIQVYAPHCLSARGNSDISFLKPGSVLVTYGGVIGRLIKDLGFITEEPISDLSPAEKFWKGIRKSAASTTFNMKLANGTIFSYAYEPFHKHSTMSEIRTLRDYIKWNEREFSKEYEEATGEKFTTTLPDITDTEARGSLERYIHYLIDEDKLQEAATPDLLKLAVENNIHTGTNYALQSYTLLIFALRKSYAKLATELIKCGAKVDELSQDDPTPPLKIALDRQLYDVAEVLIKEGANPNIITGNHESALTSAIIAGKESLVNAMLSHKADPNLKELYGNGALNAAIVSGSLEIVQSLLNHGAKIEPTSLGFAFYTNRLDIARELLDHVNPEESCILFDCNSLRQAFSNKPMIISLLDEIADAAVKKDDANPTAETCGASDQCKCAEGICYHDMCDLLDLVGSTNVSDT